jgi:hypothetical protein
MTLKSTCVGLGIALSVSACGPRERDNSELIMRIAALEQRLAIQEDIEQIRTLQFAYNYYNSGRLYRQVLDLISEHADTIEIAGRGVFRGKAGFAKNFNPDPDGTVRDRGVAFGFVLHQLAGMEVITVAHDRQSAKARVRVLTTVYDGFPDTKPGVNGGDYEMQFVREQDTWLISGLKYVHNFTVDRQADGRITPGYSRGGDKNADEPTTWYHPWPETGVLAFHFPNPVSGKFPPEITGATRYWKGNWSREEFGQTGVRPAAEWQLR